MASQNYATVNYTSLLLVFLTDQYGHSLYPAQITCHVTVVSGQVISPYDVGVINENIKVYFKRRNNTEYV
jgi:hypothetical protein